MSVAELNVLKAGMNACSYDWCMSTKPKKYLLYTGQPKKQPKSQIFIKLS
jgi:hypothetical protein